jgi:hypothetical protein
MISCVICQIGSRGESQQPSSNVHFCITHFMTTLKRKGPKATASWTRTKTIKEACVCPCACKSSLVALCCPQSWLNCKPLGLLFSLFGKTCIVSFAILFGQIIFTPKFTLLFLFCIILLLDSLKIHCKNAYASCVYRWMNYEWTSLGLNIWSNTLCFDTKSMPLVLPKSKFCFIFCTTLHGNFLICLLLLSIMLLIPVPYQNNECNCAVFVCRYAYNLYIMRHLQFTCDDYIEKPRFNTLITRLDKGLGFPVC